MLYVVGKKKTLQIQFCHFFRVWSEYRFYLILLRQKPFPGLTTLARLCGREVKTLFSYSIEPPRMLNGLVVKGFGNLYNSIINIDTCSDGCWVSMWWPLNTFSSRDGRYSYERCYIAQWSACTHTHTAQPQRHRVRYLTFGTWSMNADSRERTILVHWTKNILFSFGIVRLIFYLRY